MNQQYALIVAGGKGRRMNSGVPKQFLDLNGKPVLIHTLEVFFKYNQGIRIVLVLPEDDFGTWNAIADQHKIPSVVLQKGGETRFQSVKNGLAKIEGDGLVAIHDGVRPLVSTEIIAESFRLAAIHGSAIASM